MTIVGEATGGMVGLGPISSAVGAAVGAEVGDGVTSESVQAAKASKSKSRIVIEIAFELGFMVNTLPLGCAVWLMMIVVRNKPTVDIVILAGKVL
jgi:uncharacterized membrane protein